jgi:hypothetical protein
MSFGSKWIKPQGESVSNKFLEGIDIIEDG